MFTNPVPRVQLDTACSYSVAARGRYTARGQNHAGSRVDGVMASESQTVSINGHSSPNRPRDRVWVPVDFLGGGDPRKHSEKIEGNEGDQSGHPP